MSESLAVRKAGAAGTAISYGVALSRASTAITRVHEVLDVLAARDVHGETLTAVRHYPAHEAQWADFPAWTHGDLRAAYLGKGIRQLYSHQAAAAEAVHAGKNIDVERCCAWKARVLACGEQKANQREALACRNH